ncbi:hypothetical protein RQCS_32350 [Rhodococcus qingshengii]|nr:hypothetical protein RQCS_32350 [Rhodococcus qingshengii]
MDCGFGDSEHVDAPHVRVPIEPSLHAPGVEAITAENNRPERKQHFLRDFRQRIEGGRGLIENGHSFPHNQIRESFG